MHGNSEIILFGVTRHLLLLTTRTLGCKSLTTAPHPPPRRGSKIPHRAGLKDGAAEGGVVPLVLRARDRGQTCMERGTVEGGGNPLRGGSRNPFLLHGKERSGGRRGAKPSDPSEGGEGWSRTPLRSLGRKEVGEGPSVGSGKPSPGGESQTPSPPPIAITEDPGGWVDPPPHTNPRF